MQPATPPTNSPGATPPVNLSINEFLQTLSQSGLLPPQDLVAVREQPVANPETGSTTADLINWLIQQEKLTAYQAELLCRGRAGGLVLGNYIILDKLGQGGMGTVFKARHRRMNRIVALKVLPSSLSSIPEAIARFAREVEAAAKLQHSHIAAAYDADESEGVHFLVMEHVDGPNLAAYVREKGPLPVAAAVRLIAQAAQGLAAAHAKAIVHRDIKPSNLMVNRQGSLKVLDLGLAQMRDSSSEVDLTTDVTQTGRTMGTVDYMAPEQARDAKTVDARADIYSLGCTLYFLLSGHTPAPPGSAAEKLLWHQTQYAPPLIDVCPGCTARLESLVKRMMAKDPDVRPQSMIDVALELDACLAELPAGAEDLSLDGIEILSSDPSSTVHGSIAGRGTLMSVARIAALSAAGPTKAQSRGRWVALAVGAIGLAAIAAVVLLPRFLNPPVHPAAESLLFVAATQVPAKVFIDGQFRGEIQRPDHPLELKLPPGQRNVEVKREGFRTYSTEVQTHADKPVRVVANLLSVEPLPGPGVTKPPVSPHAAYEKLLTWVWKEGGKVEVKTGDGLPLSLASLEDLPPSPIEIVSIRLDGLGIGDADLAQLKAAPRLVELSLADTKITDDGLIHLAPLEDLTRLDLSQNNNIQGRGLEHLRRMPRLNQLDLKRTAITDQAIGKLCNLPKLRWLYLSDTATTDLGLEQLQSLKSLELLDVYNTGLSEVVVDRLKVANPKLKINWDGTDLERAVATRLIDKGATLVVAGKDEDGPPLTGLKARNALPTWRVVIKEIDLSTGAEFADDDLKQLAVLSKIESLNLVTVNVTPAGIVHLQGLKSLKSLHLAAQRLSPTVIEAFQLALPQCRIVLKEPIDAEVAREIIGRKGSLTVVSEHGVETADVVSDAALAKEGFAIRAINLANVPGIDDAAISRLHELAGLESLVLSGTGITDAGLAHLAGCKALRSLTLSDTKITAAGIAALARLPALRQLYLARTEIGRDGLKAVTGLHGLTHLSLQGMALADGDLVLLKRLENLQSLDLSNTPLTDGAGEPLSRLGKLQSLNVQGTQLTDAAVEELSDVLGVGRVVGDPPNPQRLAARWIVQNRGTVQLATGPLANLRALPRDACKVVSIDLGSLAALHPDDIVKHVSACTGLRKLNLDQTRLSNEDLRMLAGLKNLTTLSLAEVSINDKGLRHLASLTKLQSLDLTSTHVSGTGLADLAGAAELAHLHLTYAPIKADQLAHLAAFAQLRTLDVSAASASASNINDDTLAQLEKLPGLKFVGLRSARITDAGLDHLAKLKDLEVLDLEGTPVTDAGIEKLADLGRLYRILLNRTSVTDQVTITLAKIKTLRSIALKQTSVSAGSLDTLQAALGPQCEIVRPTVREPSHTGNEFGPVGQATGLGPVSPFAPPQ